MSILHTICYDVMGCMFNILQLPPSFKKDYIYDFANASSFWYIYT